MHPVEFPYTTQAGRSDPIIPVFIRCGAKGSWAWAYVDSGATLSVFREEEATALGIDLASGQPTEIRVGDGHAVAGRVHEIEIVIGEEVIRARVAFARLGVRFNLLGRQDVFGEFRITFDERQRVIGFERNDPQTVPDA